MGGCPKKVCLKFVGPNNVWSMTKDILLKNLWHCKKNDPKNMCLQKNLVPKYFGSIKFWRPFRFILDNECHPIQLKSFSQIYMYRLFSWLRYGWNGWVDKMFFSIINKLRWGKKQNVKRNLIRVICSIQTYDFPIILFALPMVRSNLGVFVHIKS